MAQSNGEARSESETRGESESDQSKRGKKGKGREAASESGLPATRRLERIADSASSTKASAYQGAMEAGFSIIIAILLGYWADEHFGTAPRYLIVGSVVGFGSMVLRLMRMRNLLEDPNGPNSTPGADESRDDE